MKTEITTEVVKKDNCEHLKPYQWEKGVSGNPKGRKNGSRNTIRGVLLLALKQGGLKRGLQKMKDRGVNIKDGSHAELLAIILLYKAEVEWDIEAIREIIKQTEKPLTKEFNSLDFDQDGPSINITRNVVHVQHAQNLQINTKRIKLKKKK